MAALVEDGLRDVVLQAADQAECIALAQASFDELAGQGSAIARWFDARIANNPWQGKLPGLGVGLRSAGRLVACRVMFAQPWWLAGERTVAAFAAHTAVDVGSRGQGLGTRLIAASRAFARITGSTTAGDVTQKAYARLGFVAVGGSDNSFFRLRCSYAGSLQSRIGTCAGRAAARWMDLALAVSERRLGRPAGFKLEPLQHCDDEVERLWLRVREQQASCLERGSRYLNWRLFEQPTTSLQLSALRERGGALRALAVWSRIGYSGTVECAVLRDLLLHPADREALSATVALLIAHWRADGISWASLEVAGYGLTEWFRGAGFEHVRSHGNRYWIAADPPLTPRLLSHWHRSGLDGDYFDIR